MLPKQQNRLEATMLGKFDINVISKFCELQKEVSEKKTK